MLILLLFRIQLQAVQSSDARLRYRHTLAKIQAVLISSNGILFLILFLN